MRPAAPPYGPQYPPQPPAWPPPNRPGYAPGQAPAYPPGYAPQMPPGNWTTRAPPPKPQDLWRKIPFGIRLRLAIGVFILFMIVIATALPPFPAAGTRAIGMSPGAWQSGAIDLSFIELRNVSDLSPSVLGYQITYHSSFLFSGPAGSYQPEPGVTVTVAYFDAGNDHRTTMDDHVTITVVPHSYGAIHGRGLSLRNQGAQVGYVDLP